MSFQTLMSSLNVPWLVAGAGASVMASLPYATSNGALLSIGALKAINLAAFATNVASVSIPGRIDGQQQEQMIDKSKQDTTYRTVYSPDKGRTLVAPSGWAFAIWGPIYLGEALLVGGQFLGSSISQAQLAQLTPGFTAACLAQSLWCASFRPAYYNADQQWPKFVSASMLGSTAFALSQVHAVIMNNPSLMWTLVPVTMHFGWTTAATLVNLNGSLAAMDTVSDRTVVAAGHASALAATAVGVTVTLVQSSPVYGLTLAWALAACSTGMRTKQSKKLESGDVNFLTRAMSVQEKLCKIGSAACALASAYVIFV